MNDPVASRAALLQRPDEPVVGGLVLTRLDLAEGVVGRHVVHDHGVEQLPGVARVAARPGQRHDALALERLAHGQEAVPVARQLGEAVPGEQLDVGQRHVEHQLVGQPQLGAAGVAGRDEVGREASHQLGLAGEVAEDAGLGDGGELRAAERGERVAHAAAADLLQRGALVVV
jgi:hypothetical protein